MYTKLLLQVIIVPALPEDDPEITGMQPQYQIGDEINLNCTSGKSYPASVLQWYINEQLVRRISHTNPLSMFCLSVFSHHTGQEGGGSDTVSECET